MAYGTGIYIPDIPIDTAERARTLRQLIKQNAPVDTGALKRSWDNPKTVQIRPDGTVEIDNPLPYSRIQDTGGDIPPYECEPGKVMRAVIDGQVRYFTKRKGFHLDGHQYIQQALQEFAASPAGKVGPPLKLKYAGSSAVFNLVDIARNVLRAAVLADAAKRRAT